MKRAFTLIELMIVIAIIAIITAIAIPNLAQAKKMREEREQLHRIRIHPTNQYPTTDRSW